MSTKYLVIQPRAGRWLTLLLALLMMPLGLWAQETYGITVAGVQVTSDNASDILRQDQTNAGKVSYNAATNTLTLNGATIEGKIVNSLESLIIYLQGTNSLASADGQNAALQNETSGATLSFTGSGSLAINSECGVIRDFTSIDFGSFNLASESAPGINFDNRDEDNTRMQSYDGYEASDLTITTDEVYPVWIYSEGQSYGYAQITASNKDDVLGDGTISFSNSTITLNGATLNPGENFAVVVGQGLSSLTAHLLGTNRFSSAFSFADETNLIFTTDTSNPGSLEASWLANWYDEVERITYRDGLVHTYSNTNDKHYVDSRTVYYGLNVAGIRVSNLNAEDILGDGGSVSYQQDIWGYTRTLTLNNATINGKIDIYGDGLTIDFFGDNTIVSTDSAAIKNSNVGLTSGLTVKSTGNTLATLKLRPGGDSFKAYEGFIINYMDNTSLFGEVNNDDNSPVAGAEITIKRVPAPVFNFPQGIVFTDEDLTITMDIPSDDFEIYWTGKSEYGQYKKYTDSFQLTTDDDSYGGYGNPSVYAYVADKEEQKRRTIDVVRLLIVTDRPTFSVASGEYAATQQVAITGLPEMEERQYDEQDYPQVWYYLDDDKENAVQYTSEATIAIDHTCRLNAYLLAVNDSGVVVNSNLFSADYIIRQEPDYHFSNNPSGTSYYPSGSTVYNLDFGLENTLPWLINVPDGLEITYSTSDAATATVNQEGVITLTGAGYVWITASNEETDDYLAHSETIKLEIRPSDPQSSIAQGAYYTGQKLELISTVPNGEMYYQIGYGSEKVKYTEPITLEKGKWEISLYTECSSEDGTMWSYGNNHPVFYVYDELTFTPESGVSSNDDIKVEIGNLPSSTPNATSVYYFFGEDDENYDNDLLYDATDKVNVAESTKVNAYIVVDGDSGYVYKTEPVKATYTVISKTQLNISYAQNSRTWASYYADEKSLETPEGLEANIVTTVSTEGVTVSPISYIPQNVPVLLKRTAEEVTEPIMAKAYQEDETADVSSNKLAGTATSKSIKTIDGDVYVLYNDGFTRATSGSVPANRAYLVFANVAAGARLWIWDDDDTTGITEVERMRNGGNETMRNGGNETFYNLQGRKIANGQKPKAKGLYISDGKKRVVK